MTEPRIKEVTISRDQLERMRDDVEELYIELRSLWGEGPAEQRHDPIEEMFGLLCHLPAEISVIREEHGITKDGVEADHPDGYLPAQMKLDGVFVGTFKRVKAEEH